LPSLKVAPSQSHQRNPLALLRDRTVLTGMAAVGLFFMGQFMLFTYVRPFLESVTRLDASGVSMALLVIGVAGFIGTSMIGAVLKRGSVYRTLAVIPVVMAVLALALVAAGASPLATSVLLGLWGLVATAAPVGWWSWLAKTLPKNAEMGGGLMVATVQLCIALGSAFGGVLFDSGGYRATFASSAGLLALGAGLVVLTARAQRTHKEVYA
jgi:predicted MFS family arabinose efflux permease